MSKEEEGWRWWWREPGWQRHPDGKAWVEGCVIVFGGTYSSVRMLTGYRTGMLVVAELSSWRLEFSFSLHGARWRET